MLKSTTHLMTSILLFACLEFPVVAADSDNLKVTEANIVELRREANNGDKDAESRLGTLYCNGEATPFVPRDDAAALSWWRKAAEQGQPEAAFSLGISYIYSFGGLTKDTAQGIQWLRVAAHNGNAKAQYYLGVSYANGNYVGRDTKEALVWLSKAANQSYPVAEAALGALYGNDSVAPNLTEALKWTQKAAEDGAPNAQFNLGQLYYQGRGVEENHAKAVKWWHKAADTGDLPAQVRLADAYAKGDGVAKDNVRAWMWYDIASRTIGDPVRLKHSLSARKSLEREMTSQDITEAKELASDWRVQFVGAHGILTDSNWMFAQFRVP